MKGNFKVDVGGDAVGIGHGATGIKTGGSPAPQVPELQRLLAELQTLLERHAAELDDGEVARRALAEADSEVRSGAPEPGKLRMWLSAITGAASGVSSVTTAVNGIRALLGGPG